MAIPIALAFRNPSKTGPYREALHASGLEAVSFMPGSAESLDHVNGLVLTGGDDVDPALYGAVPHPETGAPDRERDEFESALLRDALRRDMPVLAICRGMQLFNVVQGGTLIQHLPGTEKHRQRSGGAPVHDVAIGPPLASMLNTERTGVNSRHHQAVDRLADGLVVTARDPEDGVVEGFVLPSASFAVAVQWHPEDMAGDPVQRRLFDVFAAEARRYREEERSSTGLRQQQQFPRGAAKRG
ncbi:MAG TPA: gamma-glutamyl-gamma-aminobutyrate hydrolase family protein [Bryobacteraceae bacterium]|nr:gamma-glutamyl-gamma-aminobutyrate hydrolase family protein [Bryobacteraceae bacterium]